MGKNQPFPSRGGCGRGWVGRGVESARQPHPHPSLPPEGEGEKCAREGIERFPHPHPSLPPEGEGVESGTAVVSSAIHSKVK